MAARQSTRRRPCVARIEPARYQARETMADPAGRRGLLVTVTVAQVVVMLALTALGWGGLRPLLADPARAVFVGTVIAITIVSLMSPVNLGSGEREDRGGRRALLPAVVGSLVLAWLMPVMDRRDVWTIDGAAVRWLGVATLVVGSVLRVWPMFTLGRRFSGLVALQPDHELVTDGPYRWVRHPSYLGLILELLGWALVFRSSLGVLATVLGLVPLVDRIETEEALLASRFGSRYEDYRRRTWRLVPRLY
jgi:protein-S-isoprenylcysteine O-methyltransferase Ste14